MYRSWWINFSRELFTARIVAIHLGGLVSIVTMGNWRAREEA
jgi:hypothetical protein